MPQYPNRQFLDFETPIKELYEEIEANKKMAEKSPKVDYKPIINQLEETILEKRHEITENLTNWQKVQLSRHPDRPYTLKYIQKMCTDFVELHGDRNVKDDKAMVGGFVKLDGETVMMLGQQKGINTKMRQLRNFGMANPEGYRKALRLMKLAEKFNKPIITLVDTPGAFPGIEAEERGQGEAIARNIYEMLRLRVPVICVIIGEGASGGAMGIGVGDKVLMLENTRFHKGEEKNDLELAKQMASLADVYVNDAFGSAHRAHSSTEGIARFLPAVSGFLMEQELEYLGRAVANPEHPYIAILGGAKISDKILVVETLLSKADKLIIGGGMANTFLAAKGYHMQDSLVEEAAIETAKSILKKSGDKLILPVDAVIADKFDAEANTQIVDVDKIPAGWRMMDIGPKTLDLYKRELDGAKLIVWNGPVGVFEMPKFAEGTFALAKLLAKSGATTVIGGGDSASAVKKAGVAKEMTHVSTGGGASLEFLEGKELPGVAALNDK